MWENYEESSKFCCVTTLKKVIRYFSCHMIFVIPSLGYSVNSLRPLLERHNQEPSIRFIFPLMTIPNLPYLTPLSRTIFKIKHIKEHPIWHISCDALDQITLYSLTNGISKLERGNTRFKKFKNLTSVCSHLCWTSVISRLVAVLRWILPFLNPFVSWNGSQGWHTICCDRQKVQKINKNEKSFISSPRTVISAHDKKQFMVPYW